MARFMGAKDFKPKRESGKDPEGKAICKKCKAVYMEQRWLFDADVLKELKKDKETEQTLCPGCQKIEDKSLDGLVVLESSFIEKHKDEILNLIRREEEKAWHKSPVSKIAKMEIKENLIEIQTTTESLATRLGKAVESAYRGELEIKKVPQQKFVRVNWTRE